MNNLTEINKIDLNKFNNSFFAHFNSKEECDVFCNKYTGKLGHRCCYGKGIRLCDATSNNDVQNILKLYESV